MERFNRTLEAILSKVIADNQKDWDIHIPKALFAYRTALHESSGYSPFRINFGRSPILPINIVVGRLPLQESDVLCMSPLHVENSNWRVFGIHTIVMTTTRPIIFNSAIVRMHGLSQLSLFSSITC